MRVQINGFLARKGAGPCDTPIKVLKLIMYKDTDNQIIIYDL